MTLKIGVVMDPIQGIHVYKDSTLAIMLAAQARDAQLFYMLPEDLLVHQAKAAAYAQSIKVFDDEQHWFELGERALRPLTDFDVILMRKDPPFDMNYIFTTFILEQAEREGVLVVNKPASLRSYNEKFFITQFPEFAPQHLVTADYISIKGFVGQHKRCILKPLDGMGGDRIFYVDENERNLNVMLDVLTHHGKTPCMAQTYIPEISKGDKRILLVNGEPVPHVLARIPKADDIRGNMAAGASVEVQAISEHNLKLAKSVGEKLKALGIYFAGLDVIGDYLTEVNITCPTCIRQIDQGAGTDIAGMLLDSIEGLLT
jgi:glutathione synthase